MLLGCFFWDSGSFGLGRVFCWRLSSLAVLLRFRKPSNAESVVRAWLSDSWDANAQKRHCRPTSLHLPHGTANGKQSDTLSTFEAFSYRCPLRCRSFVFKPFSRLLPCSQASDGVLHVPHLVWSGSLPARCVSKKALAKGGGLQMRPRSTLKRLSSSKQSLP